jgi:hypothetical protein
MNNLMLLAEFIAKSDLKKASLAVYFWSTLCLLKWKVPPALSEDSFVQLGLIIIIAAFGGNVLTHYIRSRYPVAGEAKPNAGTPVGG